MANNSLSVQLTTLKNLVTNVVPSDYSEHEPINQRPHKTAGADEFLAFLIFWAYQAKCFANNVATALPGCTIVSEGQKPIMMSISIRNGRVYIQDGQHRYYWSINIFDKSVLVSGFTGNIEVDAIIAKLECANQPFSKLKPWIKEAIENALVALEVVYTDSESIEKVLFDDKNRGSSVKTNESINNNFCNVPIYQEISRGISQIKGEISDGYFKLPYKEGIKNIVCQKYNEKTLFQLITRCMTLDSNTTGAKATAIEAMTNYINLTTSQAHKMAEKILQSLCLGASLVGSGRALNTYAGACAYAMKNPKHAKEVNKKATRFMMQSFVFYWEAEASKKKPSQTNSHLLSTTTHSKSNVKYASEQLTALAEKVVKNRD